MASKSSSTMTTTTREIQRALGKTTGVTAEEEKILRMRHGAKVDPNAPLARVGQNDPEIADELMLLEMELFKAYRAHLSKQRRAAKGAIKAAAKPPPTQSRAKDKIVRALRKKR